MQQKCIYFFNLLNYFYNQLIFNSWTRYVLYITVSKTVGRPTWKTCFHSFTFNLDIITSFTYPTDCITRLFYKNVTTYIKTLLHVSVYQLS